MLPSNIAGGQYGPVGSEHSHAVAGVVNAGSDVVAVSSCAFGCDLFAILTL